MILSTGIRNASYELLMTLKFQLFSLQLQHPLDALIFFFFLPGKIFVFYLLLKDNYWYKFECILLVLLPFPLIVNKSKKATFLFGCKMIPK